MNNVNMANMAMGGPVGAPMGMVNNGAMMPQGMPRQPSVNDNTRSILNTYIYEYFVRYGMYDCARALLAADSQVKVSKDARRDENGNLLGNGLGDEMDTDTKEDIDSKRPDDIPAPSVISPLPDSCFLSEWFNLFWDMFNAQKGKGGNPAVNQYVNHTQSQSRLRQAQQQEMLRQMRPSEFSQQQNFMMRNMPNGAMMNMKQGNNLPRTAIANSQNNPQAMQMLQQKQGQMSRDPSDMDGNRPRPSSPGSTDNPSPSKRPRLDGGPFPTQPGMVPNGGPMRQGMPGQQVNTTNPQQVQQMLLAHNINPANLNAEQLQTFTNQSPAVQAKTIATYAQNLQQHQNNQMNQLPNKPMPNATGPQAQGSPMVPQGPDGAALNAYYNAGDMGGPGAMRPAQGAGQAGGGSNHALQDYQMQLMLLEQQNKKRLMMARQEQDGMNGAMRPDGSGGPGGPGGPPGPNAQPFQGTSPPGGRIGASPNPTEQMKRQGQMGNAGMGSPLPDSLSRGSPNPVNFMGANMDPATAPNFFKGMNNMEGNMVAGMNGMRPPNGQPGQQPFNQMNPQQLMAARQQAAQGGPGMQWQQGGPNGNPMGPQGPQAQGQVQGTPQQRAMPPPSAPAAANANQRTQTASPQVTNAAPPTPQQSTKAAPKKKNDKNAKSKAATQKKANANATPAAEPAADPEPPTPATPITPVNPHSLNKNAPNAAAAPGVPNGQPPAPAPPAPAAVPPPPQPDPQSTAFMDNNTLDFGAMDFANPLTSDNVLNDFDFDSFLQNNDDDPGAYDFGATNFLEGGEIGAE